MVFNQGDADRNGWYNGAFGTAALQNNETGFSNNAMGDSALFGNQHGAANTAIGDVALENNDAAETALPITTRQLALRRSSITLMAVRTQPWVQGQDKT